MALQLRRGTNAERAAETFAVGELIYTTDTKQIYVGDGATLGGVLVSNSAGSSPASLTQNLNLNGFAITGSGSITATNFIGDGSQLTGIDAGLGIQEGQEYAIDIQGNVRGDDTTVIVDAALGRVSADHYGDGSNLTNITLGQLDGVNTTGVTTDSILKYDGTEWAIGTDSGAGGGASAINELTDVDTTGLTVDSILKYNGANWVIGTDNSGGSGNGVQDGFTYEINVQGYVLADDSSVIIDPTNGSIVSSSITGDLQGSVFGDDSTLIVDAVNNSISSFRSNMDFLKTRYVEPAEGFTSVTFQPTDGGTTNGVFVKAEDDTPFLQMLQVSSSDLSADTDPVGQLNFIRADTNGVKTFSTLNVTKDYVELSHEAAGGNPASVTENNALYIKDGTFGIGTKTPAAKLDVEGEIKVGSLTTTERNALTAANGMLLYNETTNQLESYENGAWAATGGAGGASIGNFTLGSSTIDTTDSSGIIMTPAVTVSSDLTVENNLTVTNTVTADRFVATGTETPEISASANLNLTAGNAVVLTSSPLRLASFTTTERNALAAQNGDIIYNTTDNKFQGYENGAWANLI